MSSQVMLARAVSKSRLRRGPVCTPSAARHLWTVVCAGLPGNMAFQSVLAPKRTDRKMVGASM